MENARNEISENEKKLSDAKSQIDSSESEINKKEKELNSKQKEYESSLKEYNTKKKELENAESQINSSQKEIDSKKSELENGKTQYESGIEALEAGVTECENALQNPNLPESQRQIIEQKLAGYKMQLEQTKSAYNDFINNTYNPSINKLNEAQVTLDTKKSEYNSGKEQLETANTKLKYAKKQLDSGKSALSSAKNQLKTAKQEYNTNKNKLEEAKKELQDKENEYNENLQEFQEKEPDATKEINENEEKLNDSRKKLEELSMPTYSVYNRRELPGGEGYKIYETVSEIVDSLAKVFPVFLYFVAALVTLTTMARFVGDERITPIWKRMKFTHKVTARNIFRYKKRMFMTIFGVAGAASILFAGFSVQSSISKINERQFEHLIKYDATKSAGKNNDEQSIKLIVPENTDEFDKYISVVNRKTGNNIELQNDGVVISERLSTLLGVKVGDSFEFTDSNSKKRTVKVSGICEMYAGHFIFMNEDEYKNIFDDDLKTNARLLIFKDSTLENVENQSARFMVLIIIAVLLAIVILYNLTNINVAERIRELCTIKVLGFYDKETTMYIYRETIILSAIGIVVGWLIGIVLHNYILTVVPPDEIMFNPTLWIGAFIIPLVCISGTLKNFIDRTYAKYTKIKNKDFYYIGSGSDTSKESIDGAVETVNGFLRCLDNVNLKGIVYGLSLNDQGDARYSESLKEAYELGKSI